MSENEYRLTQYDYEVPPGLIAQEPLRRREHSRLLVVDRRSDDFREVIFKDIVSFLKAGDVVVINNTKVIKARLQARKKTGAGLEVLLIKEREKGLWEVLVKPGKRARRGDVFFFSDDGSVSAEVIDHTPQGGRLLRFSPADIRSFIETHGRMPTPPYIKKEVEDDSQYQTVYAQHEGAVAAPTAGFHFTGTLLDTLRARGIEIVYITLHCGLPTFRPIKTDDIREHPMESEVFEITPGAAAAVNRAKKERRRVIAVGTTSIRTLESAAVPCAQGYEVKARTSQTGLYIFPGYEFKIVDAVVTNFHTPCSTNLVLVSTFAGVQRISRAYSYALRQKFRFFSFGDAMLII